MKPDTRTVTELFERDVRYVVPLYQRPYVWSEEAQWEPMWEDVRVILDHEQAGLTQDSPAWSHFLGAIVLEQETQAPGEIPVFTVIDGQQLLTTLQILLAAARRVASESGADDDAELLHDLVTNNRRKASGEQLFKVWPTNVNRSAFQAVMAADGPGSDRMDDPANLIDEAFSYFVQRIRDWVRDEVPDETSAARVRRLRVTLVDLLKVVSITLERDDNAQVIFETLNARGTPLLALDLVKNAVFHEAERQRLNVDELYADVWKPQLDDDYWREPVRQGRLFRPRAELFLMHWLAMKLRRVIPATELFSTFRKDVLQRAQSPAVDDLVYELCRDAETMRSFDRQPSGSPEALFFERLEALDTTTMMPLALLLFREPAITVETRRRALAIVESWLVRRALMRHTTSRYNRHVPVLVDRVAADPARADEIIAAELRTGVGLASRWPTDDELRRALEHQDAYGLIARPRLVMALAAVERSLYTSKTEAMDLPSTLSLEHVMPREWRANWPLPQTATAEEEAEATAVRVSRIHKIGNLTLTTLPLNAALSNSAWSVKQRELNRASRLLLNADLTARYGERFDEGAIDERTRQLTDRVLSIWPGPQTAPASDPGNASPAPSRASADQPSDLHLSCGDELPGAGEPEAPTLPNNPARELVRDDLLAGLTPDQIYMRSGRRTEVWFTAIEEEAKLAGEFGAYDATPANAVDLRDSKNLRWERIAVRIFGDPRETQAAKELYDRAKGEGASRRSYTGRGRRFPDMD